MADVAVDNSTLGDIRREAEHNTATIRNDVLSGYSDMRYEYATSKGEILKEIGKTTDNINADVKDTGWRVNDNVGREADRVVSTSTDYFIASQNRQFDNAMQIAALKASTEVGFGHIAKDIEHAANMNALESAKVAAAVALENAKVAAAVALGQAQLERTIYQDGNETRRLMNELNNDGLNRQLIERNAEMLDHRHEARQWRHGFDNAQFAAITSQLNAFGSQLQETRQGVVNFGSMSGNAGRQQSTNNVA
jgi:hypothetical protein